MPTTNPYLTRYMLFLVIGTTLFLSQAACRASDDDPAAVTRHFYKALVNKDFTTAKKYATPESAPLLDMMGTLSKKVPDSLFGEDTIFTTKSLKEVNDLATVQVIPPANNKSIIIKLSKESGHWKVAFDKSLE